MTEHLDEAVFPDRVHDPLGVKLTVPVGVVGAVAVSTTEAVHVVVWPGARVAGTQMTVDAVGSIATATMKLPELEG